MKKTLIYVATFFNIGKIPFAPGSWASLITTIIIYLLYPYFNSTLNLILSFSLILLLGIPAASQAEKYFKKKDPRECVIDEVAGQMLCLILLPHTYGYYLAAFFIFRLFDIFKPFPIKQCEKLSGGLGIILDDLIAGLYTFILLEIYIILKLNLF